MSAAAISNGLIFEFKVESDYTRLFFDLDVMLPIIFKYIIKCMSGGAENSILAGLAISILKTQSKMIVNGAHISTFLDSSEERENSDVHTMNTAGQVATVLTRIIAICASSIEGANYQLDNLIRLKYAVVLFLGAHCANSKIDYAELLDSLQSERRFFSEDDDPLFIRKDNVFSRYEVILEKIASGEFPRNRAEERFFLQKVIEENYISRMRYECSCWERECVCREGTEEY